MKSLTGYCLLTMTFMVSSTHQMEVNIKDNSPCVFTHIASDKKKISNSKTSFCVIVRLKRPQFLTKVCCFCVLQKKIKIKSCNVRYYGNFYGNCFSAWADCTQIKALSPQASSGVYLIQPPGIKTSFQVPFGPLSL